MRLISTRFSRRFSNPQQAKLRQSVCRALTPENYTRRWDDPVRISNVHNQVHRRPHSSSATSPENYGIQIKSVLKSCHQDDLIEIIATLDLLNRSITVKELFKKGMYAIMLNPNDEFYLQQNKILFRVKGEFSHENISEKIIHYVGHLIEQKLLTKDQIPTFLINLLMLQNFSNMILNESLDSITLIKSKQTSSRIKKFPLQYFIVKEGEIKEEDINTGKEGQFPLVFLFTKNQTLFRTLLPLEIAKQLLTDLFQQHLQVHYQEYKVYPYEMVLSADKSFNEWFSAKLTSKTVGIVLKKPKKLSKCFIFQD